MSDLEKKATAAERLAAVQAKRDAVRTALEEQRQAQRADDLEALSVIEDKFGQSNVVWMDLPFTPGYPTLAAARTPTPGEMSRYRARMKPKGADKLVGDYVAAAEELAESCRVFPLASDDYAELKAARPGLHVQLGLAALKLGGGVEQDESKS